MAIDVPEIVLIAVVLVYQLDVMEETGANTSTQGPQLENDQRVSLLVVAPTVIAAGARAGDKSHASE